MRIINVLEHMHGRSYNTGGWALFQEATGTVVNTRSDKNDYSDKFIAWEARQFMRMVEAMCGYSV